MQQRMRVGNETLFKELMMAGAGPYQGSNPGTLLQFFAPILPRRTGLTAPDPPTTFRTDAITLAYIPNSYSQTTISRSMPTPSSELKVTRQTNCPEDTRDLCGFDVGDSVIIFDESGNFDTFTITEVQDQAAHLQHRGQTMSHAYDAGAHITQIVSNTYYLDRTTNKLMRDDGGGTIVPLVDNVVDLRFQYFGDINPPTKPDPGIGGAANCLYDASHTLINLPVLTANDGSLASLPASMLTDGPWCGGGTNAYDADLLRVRKVRVTYRVQAANPALRGRDTALFRNPGTASGGEKFIPDYAVSFDVTPRNLNLTR
jgi:hypothetical protein